MTQAGQRQGERGAVMMVALIVMLFGGLVVGGILTYLDASTRDHVKARDRAEAHYAAEAGIYAVISDLVDNDSNNDPPEGDSSYTWTGDSVNGLIPVVDITHLVASVEYVITSSADGTTITCEIHKQIWMDEPVVDIISWRTS